VAPLVSNSCREQREDSKAEKQGGYVQATLDEGYIGRRTQI
jgi:hypothetical protein